MAQSKLDPYNSQVLFETQEKKVLTIALTLSRLKKKKGIIAKFS